MSVHTHMLTHYYKCFFKKKFKDMRETLPQRQMEGREIVLYPLYICSDMCTHITYTQKKK